MSDTLRRDQRAIVLDGMAWAFMVGIGEYFLGAFVLAVTGNGVAAGLVTSLPLLAGAMLQLVSPAAIRRLGSHRAWAVLTASLQAAAFVPLLVGALAGTMPLWAIFACAALYYAAGHACGSAWAAWVNTLVPADRRTRFFASRSRLMQFATLAALVLSAATLDPLRNHLGVAAFAILFALAGTARAYSAYQLSRYSTATIPDQSDGTTGRSASLLSASRSALAALRARSPAGAGPLLLVYMLAAQFSVQISSPFVGPFLLDELEVSLGHFSLLFAVQILARIVSLPLLGRLGARYGAQRVLWVGGLGIVPVSAMWAASDELWWLILVQTLSGVAWAAFELGTFLLTLERISDRDRAALMTLYYLGYAMVFAAGSVLGGVLLRFLGEDTGAYHAVFVLSSVARLLPVAILLRVVR